MRTQFDHFISLGTQCQVADCLKVAGLRRHAYPFDWIVSPEWSVNAVLEADFAGFFEPGKLRPISHDPRCYCVENAFGCIFQHEFTAAPTNASAEQHQVRYERRITRFREVCHGVDTVLFVRKKIGAIEASYLRDLMTRYCPRLQFQILCVNERAQHWGMDRVINRQALISDTTDELSEACRKSWLDMLSEFQLVSAVNVSTNHAPPSRSPPG